MAVVVKRAGRMLKIEIPIGKPVRMEGSRKLLRIAGTDGAMPTLAQFKGKAIVIDLTVFIDTDERDEYKQRARLNILQIEGKIR